MNTISADLLTIRGSRLERFARCAYGAVLLFATLAIAQTSLAGDRLIPFQARLTDASGSPLADGVYDLTFALYDTPTGGTLLNGWSERHPAVSVIGGVLNVLLGSITDFDNPGGQGNGGNAVTFRSDEAARYLGIRIGSAQEMVPRHQLVPSFQARAADNADKLAGRDWTAILVGGASDPAAAKIAAARLEDKGIGPAQIAADSITGDEIKEASIPLDDLAPSLQSAFVPQGAVMAFDLPSCPNGWSEYTPARGRTIIGVGQGSGLSNRNLGNTGGAERHRLTVSELPSHSHTRSNAVVSGTGVGGDGGSWRTGYGTRSTSSVGGSAFHNIMQPWLALRYCKKQ